MQDILEQYEHISDTEDVFSFWKQELKLRTGLRQRDLSPVRLDNTEQIDLLYRSLYFAQRRFDFFLILFPNLRFMPVLEWLVNAPERVMLEFLNFLPWYIINHRIQPVELEFIVRIYNESYHGVFKAIVNVLDADSCAYLVTRTANPELRELLNNRLANLYQIKQKSYYNLGSLKESNNYPTFYGDKVRLIRKAIDLLEESSPNKFQDPYQMERFLLQIQAAELVFKCGLVEDSLALLVYVYVDYQQNNRLVELVNDQKIYKAFAQLLRTVIPVFCLVYEPLQAFSSAQKLYDKYFPLISPQVASLKYLQLWEVITRGFHNDTPDSLWELFYTCRGIAALRPSAPPLLREEERDNVLSEPRLKELLVKGDELLSALPHETFVIMELIRLLHYKGKAALKGEIASRLLKIYLQLFKWLPCRIFMHDKLLEQIAPLVDDSSRYQAQRIIESTQAMDSLHIKQELVSRYQLFRKGDNTYRDILVGKLLGAL